MRLWVMSDLHHFAGWPFEPPAETPDADVLVIAGDVAEEMSRKSIPFVAETFKRYGLPIIYVPGNHDFYKAHLTHELVKAQMVAEHHGIHLLATGQSVVLGDTRFVGATLWTDFDLGKWGYHAEKQAISSMNDYKYIRTGSEYRRALPKDTIDIHYEQRQRLENVLATSFDGATVVVTHHAPLERSLRGGEVIDILDPAYASDLSEMVERYQPELWVHGHIHVSRDYEHANTRIISNPRGYMLEHIMRGRGERRPENPNFDPAMVIDVVPRPKSTPRP